MERIEAWLTLYMTPGLGSAGCRQLVKRFGEPALALQASRRELETVPGLKKECIESIGLESIRTKARKEYEQARKSGVAILCWDDPGYPAMLREIPGPPALIYVRGSAASLSGPAISIVGSRAASSYGTRAAEDLAGQLARLGYTIVSGLALGIDTAAHRGALQAGGKTIAVLGCGVDIVYPRQNLKLYGDIQGNGAVISEYPFGTKPESFRFPGRNRIISGLSRGVVIVEAARRSGSLITANYALEQGREVFAVPGRVDSPKSEGTHRLLQDGAKLVLNADDIVNELGPDCPSSGDAVASVKARKKDLPELDEQEKVLLGLLEVYPKPIDDIITESGMPVEKVNELMLLLELKGACEVLPGRQYQLRN
ncbi:MAG: DNA-processing protein DprA [Proteobacteria bacterium]|nr:DNA-processing protein DprA [Pseudomonadota bacterium]MBU1738922.1 DNA-processing protein DprA [Pseudomonadota bacterium]